MRQEDDKVSVKTARSFEHLERLPEDIRECVHEYGYPIVSACLTAGLRKAGTIHQLVREIWDGARQSNQRRVAGGQLDWMLIQCGAEITAATLLRVLANSGLAIVPVEATREMIDASLKEVSGHNVICTKSEKHRRRLKAAIDAGSKHLLPKLRKAVQAEEKQ